MDVLKQLSLLSLSLSLVVLLQLQLLLLLLAVVLIVVSSLASLLSTLHPDFIIFSTFFPLVKTSGAVTAEPTDA